MSDEATGDNRENALAVKKLDDPISVGEGGIVLRTANDVWAIAKGIHKAGMAPKSLDSADKVAVAIMTGAEAGLSPMMSIRSIYVINGAPAWLSKAARALVLNSGLLKPGTSIEEGVIHAEGCTDHETEKRGCVNACYGYCRTHRNGDVLPRENKFSVGDAKTAGLWDDPKKQPWKKYHKRMLVHRSSGFHFDDCWSEVLMGLTTIEVLRDHPQAAFVREDESLTAIVRPPGVDPLIAPASSAAEIIDVEPEGEETADEGAGAPVTDGDIESSFGPAPSTESDVPEEPGTDAQVEQAGLEEAEAATHDATEAPGSSAATEPEPHCYDDDGQPCPGVGDPGCVDPGPDHEICEARGCGHSINLGTEMSWPTPTGRRCADCGPAPKAK